MPLSLSTGAPAKNQELKHFLDANEDGEVPFASPPGVGDGAWWNYLHKHGFLDREFPAPQRRGRSGWPMVERSDRASSQKIPGWIGSLIFWADLGDSGPPRPGGVGARTALVRRAVRVASKDPDFLAAVDSVWRASAQNSYAAAEYAMTYFDAHQAKRTPKR